VIAAWIGRVPIAAIAVAVAILMSVAIVPMPIAADWHKYRLRYIDRLRDVNGLLHVHGLWLLIHGLRLFVHRLRDRLLNNGRRRRVGGHRLAALRRIPWLLDDIVRLLRYRLLRRRRPGRRPIGRRIVILLRHRLPGGLGLHAGVSRCRVVDVLIGRCGIGGQRFAIRPVLWGHRPAAIAGGRLIGERRLLLDHVSHAATQKHRDRQNAQARFHMPPISLPVPNLDFGE
jgi:hypothetical protein